MLLFTLMHIVEAKERRIFDCRFNAERLFSLELVELIDLRCSEVLVLLTVDIALGVNWLSRYDDLSFLQHFVLVLLLLLLTRLLLIFLLRRAMTFDCRLRNITLDHRVIHEISLASIAKASVGLFAVHRISHLVVHQRVSIHSSDCITLLQKRYESLIKLLSFAQLGLIEHFELSFL